MAILNGRPNLTGRIAARSFEAADGETISTSLHEIYRPFFRPNPACLANRLERNRVPAARTAALLIVAWGFDWHFLFAVGTVAGVGTFPGIAIKDVMLRNADFGYPAIPVLGQRWNLREISVPGVGLALMPAFQFFGPYAPLVVQNGPIGPLFGAKVFLYLFGIGF